MNLTSWSPSRFERYTQCPLLAKLSFIDKLCPLCFKGRLHGGFDTPEVCDTCGKTIEQANALTRGSEIGKNLELYVKGKEKKLHKEIRHKEVIELAETLRAEAKKGTVKVEEQIVLDVGWKPCSPFDKTKAWLRTKLDVLRLTKSAEVIDWKTGGIDKRNGSVRAEAKYDDQLEIYAVATLAAFPALKEVKTALVFVDCGPRFDPKVTRESVPRKALAKLQKKWVTRVVKMLSDDIFAPRPSEKCRWCNFSQGKGGPCQY